MSKKAEIKMRVPKVVQEYRKKVARAGGVAVREKYGPDHFKNLGKKSGKARKKQA